MHGPEGESKGFKAREGGGGGGGAGFNNYFLERKLKVFDLADTGGE